ncbi:hypothetical protein G7Y89_g7596 [Cudoniella acicularis]|uniref:Uncharacterized protein n=1 Tax=Cudoniella acicularis TaxID=354080 RepID=A0A8H4RI55_9HELO|nr:hypothetical protein G7Y89_g7596 [Cudoniella acicularis]
MADKQKDSSSSSLSFRGTNPLDNPLTIDECQLAALRTRINRKREEKERVKKQSNPRSTGVSLFPSPPTGVVLRPPFQ